MQALVHDVRLALRSLRRSPGFTALCALALALGIGANSAIFSLVQGVLLERLPYRDPDRLVALWETLPTRPKTGVSGPDLADWRAQSSAFEGLAAVSSWGSLLTGDGAPEMLIGRSVSGDFFSVLGVEAALGRTFDPGAGPDEEYFTVVLAHDVWQNRFGGDGAILGRRLLLDGEPHTVLGVLPEDFDYPGSFAPAFWVRGRHDLPRVPDDADAIAADRNARYFGVVGRLAPGVSLDEARADMARVMANARAAYPETNADRDAQVTPLAELFVGEVRAPLVALMVTVAFVLLIACTNIASLVLARATARRRSLAVHSALGARRGALIRQMLAECTVLALLGGLLGLPLALFGLEAMLALVPVDLPRLDEVTLSAPVLAFTFLASLLTALVVGLLPALQASRLDLRPLLGGDQRGGEVPGSQRLRGALVTAQVALAIVLLIGTGLLLRSFLSVRAVDVGFEPRGVLGLGLILPHTQYQEGEQIAAFHGQLLERVEALPEVRSAGLVSHVPLGGMGNQAAFEVEGQAAAPGQEPKGRYQVVSEDTFRTLQIPLLAGRVPAAGDTAGSLRVAAVNESMARQFWPGQEAVGQRLRRAGKGEEWATVVGVVGDVRQAGLEQPVEPEAYFAYQQSPSIFIHLLARTRGEPLAAEGPIRDLVLALDKDQPVYSVQPLAALVADSLAQRRFLLTLVGLFAALALGMAALGIYGVVAYSVSRRRAEIGIRMALGAQRSRVLGEVLRQGLVLTAGGLGLGLLLAFFAARAMGSLLFGVAALDAATFVLVPLALLAVALAASYFPARKATRVDPAATLRQG